MEHAKKLMLIDPRLIRPSMREKTLSKLDEEIEQTLSSDLEDSEKAQRYIAALKKYKYYESPKREEDSEAGVESKILSTISVAQRHKARRLLEHLKRDADVKIGDEGEFIYRQQKVSESNVGDLIYDLLQKKTGEHPRGWREFADVLKALNVPKDLIENTARWKFIQASPETVKKAQVTPSKATPQLPTRSGKRARWINYDD